MASESADGERLDDRVPNTQWPREEMEFPAQHLLSGEEQNYMSDFESRESRVKVTTENHDAMFKKHRNQLIWTTKLFMLQPDNTADPVVYRLQSIEGEVCTYKRTHEDLVQDTIRSGCCLEFRGKDARVGDVVYVRNEDHPERWMGPLAILRMDKFEDWRVRNSGGFEYSERRRHYVFAGKDPGMLGEAKRKFEKKRGPAEETKSAVEETRKAASKKAKRAS